MRDTKKSRNSWVLALAVLATAGIAAILAALGTEGSPLTHATRSAALMGYQLVFLSIVSSAYMMDLVRFFGRPFIEVHHALSVTGLVFITAHSIFVAVQNGTAGVFVPQFDSLEIFLALGGRPAWYLIALAAAAALLRRRIGNAWRAVHFLNYAAFALATAHANLLGANFQADIPRIVSWVMLLAILAVFFRKRAQAKKATHKRVAA